MRQVRQERQVRQVRQGRQVRHIRLVRQVRQTDLTYWLPVDFETGIFGWMTMWLSFMFSGENL